MSLRSLVLAPLTTALVLGLLVSAPVPATAAAHAPDQASQRQPEERRQDSSLTVFARSSYLCVGYRACRDAGMGNGGYANANDKMYWRMYSGHNCTNYAAYRMVKSGLPNERPWSGGGNATYWGTSVPRLTNGTPSVGAVAWWKANNGPAGSAGHVAYVERVVSKDQIVVSQDSWGGDFSWATITRSSGNWPNGFVHFNDVPITNKAVPVVTGIAKVGAVLTATAGTWRPADADVSYQWFANGTAITDATSSTLKLTRARLDQRITVRTTAVKLGYPTKAVSSAQTAAVQPGALRNTGTPTVSGQPTVDSTLTLSPGTWTPTPTTLRYQWLADGQPIAGATGTTLALAPGLVGRTITATVTAARAGYDDVTARTAATAPVAPGTFTVSTPPSVQGTAKRGETLTLDHGTIRPSGAEVAVQWLRDGVPVLNATGPTYQVSDADLGSRVSARITLTRAGYTTATVTTPSTVRVRSDPRLKVQAAPEGHRLHVTVTFTAPGVPEVTGAVVVRTAGVVKRVTLHHGAATVTLRNLPEGRRTLRIRYTGSDTVARLFQTRTVRIG